MIHSQSYHAIIDTPLPGEMCLGVNFTEQGITQIDVLPHSVPLQHADDKRATELLSQLQSYFSNAEFIFTIPLALAGTSFQQKVWMALLQLPVGSRCAYGELAKQLNSGARAVAGACRANPVPIIVPCHRVVSANGLGGYMGQQAGHGLEMKEWLLAHEGARS